MLGGKNKQPHLGYTIVEVMIVLAVSGFMFVIAATFINGKQERASFTQGSTGTASMLQGIVEDVTDGHYSDAPLTCSVTGGSVAALTASVSGSSAQGTNQDCVFLGKLIDFYKVGSGSRNNYSVYSLAAARSITNLSGGPVGVISGLKTDGVVSQSLTVKNMDVIGTDGSHNTGVYNIGFVQGLGNIDPGSGVYLSGAQQPISLIYSSAASIDTLTANDLHTAKAAAICLTDGSRRAKVLIGQYNTGSGDTNNQLTINVQQLGSGPCTS